ncbi:MAG: hypothetical protein ACI9O5_001551, partial [Algoriphagus sp.]
KLKFTTKTKNKYHCVHISSASNPIFGLKIKK